MEVEVETDYEEYHQCHFCGTEVKDGKESNGESHLLSDCRPDLVEHEIGELCTWAHDKSRAKNETCYAYQDHKTNKWTDEHTHFYKDGPT